MKELRGWIERPSAAIVAATTGFFFGLVAGPIFTRQLVWRLLPFEIMQARDVIPFGALLGTALCMTFALAIVRPTSLTDRRLLFSFAACVLATAHVAVGIIFSIDGLGVASSIFFVVTLLAILCVSASHLAGSIRQFIQQ